jgi:hypothetical protein
MARPPTELDTWLDKKADTVGYPSSLKLDAAEMALESGGLLQPGLTYPLWLIFKEM